MKDDTIIFRWDAERSQAFRKLAQSKGLSVSAFLRNLLDNYLLRLGLIKK